MNVLAIDVGTSSCKAGVADAEGFVAVAGREYGIRAPGPGYAELDVREVRDKVFDAVDEVLAAAGADEVRAVSFSSMGEAVVPVGRGGEALGPSILGYDARGASHADALLERFGEQELYRISPNSVGPQFTITKLMWLRDNQPDLYAATRAFLLWADYFGHVLGAEPYATNSLANRTMLFDVTANAWSDALLEWSGLDGGKLGRIVGGGDVVGVVSAETAKRFGLRDDTLLVAGGHDQCANALGSGCVRDGTAVVGMGTYEAYCPIFAWPADTEAFRREGMNLEHHVVDGLFATFLYHHSGLLVNWFRRAFAPNERPEAGGSVYDILNAEMPDRPTGLLFLPHNEPPQWPRYLDKTAGAFVGLKTTTTRGEMFRALLEGITFFFVDAVRAMERVGVKPAEFLATGGGSRSDAWMQMRADVIGTPFTRLAVSEGSLSGAAILAGVKAGLYAGHEEGARVFAKKDRTFEPRADMAAAYRELYGIYETLYPSLGGTLARLDGFAALI